MNFDYSHKTIQQQQILRNFMQKNIYPNERRYHEEINSGDRWQPLPLIEELRKGEVGKLMESVSA